MPYKNSESKRAWWKRYYAANAERLKEVNRKRWQDDPVAFNAIRRAKYQENPEPIRATVKKRHWQDIEYSRMKLSARHHGCLPDLLQQVLERDGHMCQHCWTRDDLSFDHVVPVSKGGQSEFWNLQILCRPCNSKKGAH